MSRQDFLVVHGPVHACSDLKTGWPDQDDEGKDRSKSARFKRLLDQMPVKYRG